MSSQPTRRLKLGIGGIGLLAGLCASFAFLAAPASAHLVEHLIYSHSITGADAVGVSSPGFNEIEKVRIDQTSNVLYVATAEGSGRLYKFDLATGQSAEFSGLSPNTVISPRPTSEASSFSVDNSNTSTQGRIYAFLEFGEFHTYLPSGLNDPSFPFPTIPNGDLCGSAVGPDGDFWGSFFESGIKEYDPITGELTGKTLSGPSNEACDFEIDGLGNFYVPINYAGGIVKKFSPSGVFQYNLGGGTARSVAVDRLTNSVYVNDGTLIREYASDGTLLDTFGGSEGSYSGLGGSRGIAVDEDTHDVYVANMADNTVDVFAPGPPLVAPDASTGVAVPQAESAELVGVLNADGVETTDCHFEWGLTESYGGESRCAEGDNFSGNGDQPVSTNIGGLTRGKTYHFRLDVTNTNGFTTRGVDRTFVAQEKPLVVDQYVNSVVSDEAKLNAKIDPGGGATMYRFEYGPDTAYGTTKPIPSSSLASTNGAQLVSQTIGGLEVGAEYHYRVVATNAAGTTDGPDRTFSTFNVTGTPVTDESCPNSLARQQTGSIDLLDCRAYELVSAADTRGYSVESDLIPGQKPLGGYPNAPGKLLYAIHDGGIPGTGSPTNKGPDPYLATRGPDGWHTEYVGIPADGGVSSAPFSSTLADASSNLDSFAFSGPEICSPCFADGSTGIPLRLPDGDLVQGMKGSMSQPSAEPVGFVGKALSADGTHLIFGADKEFEPAGREGSISIYDRDIPGMTTQVVSTLPSGQTMEGEVGELAVSEDGKRIVVGQLISTDADGNHYWHLYMHIGDSPNTIDLTPGTTSGVLYNGMTSDGSIVYFTTVDALATAANQDTDTSADLFRSEVDGSSANLTRVSTGSEGAGNSDACTPVANWNVNTGAGKCGTVAFAGGAGIGSGDGSVYFLSPERLDGTNGEANEANLYVSKPGQATPHFVAMLDSSAIKPQSAPPKHELDDNNFISGFITAGQIAIDQSDGEIYVTDRAGGPNNKVSRFTATGEPSDFSSLGSNQITGQEGLGGSGEGQIAVDSAPSSPLEGALYVTTNSSNVRVYAHNGQKLGELSSEGEVCGVSVDQNNGDVYLGQYANRILRYSPISAVPLEYGPREEITAPNNLCNISEDSNGHVYAWPYNGGPVTQYPTSAFAIGGASPPGVEIGSGVHSQSDPQNGDLYVNEGTQISRYDSTGTIIEQFGAGILSGSRGVAINEATKTVYATVGNRIVTFKADAAPYEPINNPAVLHGVHQTGVPHSDDFQVTPDGRFAAFASVVPLTGYDSHGRYEVFRYAAAGETLTCVSCAPTNARPLFGDATLASSGLSLSDDGRVFFTTPEPLTLLDSNSKKDVYEWAGGVPTLVSHGVGAFDSGLLSATHDGKDVFFFTRDTLAPEDGNGTVMKVYDAREDGGHFVNAPTQPCAASDECHGPGTQAAPPAVIGSYLGSPGQVPSETRCRKGFVRKRGKCVKRHARQGARGHHHHRSRRNG